MVKKSIFPPVFSLLSQHITGVPAATASLWRGTCKGDVAPPSGAQGLVDADR